MVSMASRKKAKAKGVASRLRAPGAARAQAAKRKFEEGLVKRGEAVPAGTPLPSGATHEIVSTDAAGHPILKRRRFSLK
jgi:hypothetical protein